MSRIWAPFGTPFSCLAIKEKPEFLERIGVGEPDPGPVKGYGSSGSGSLAWAHLAMACMGTEVSPVEEFT